MLGSRLKGRPWLDAHGTLDFLRACPGLRYGISSDHSAGLLITTLRNAANMPIIKPSIPAMAIIKVLCGFMGTTGSFGS